MGDISDISFTRSFPTALQDRADWMLEAIRFMRLRSWMATKWAQQSRGMLESRCRIPKRSKGLDLQDLKLSDNVKDAYHAASKCQEKFNTYLYEVLELAKPKSKRNLCVCDTWKEYNAAMDKWEHSLKTASVASVAELDAVHGSLIKVPLKDKDRTSHKAKDNYAGDITQVRDILRASIVLNSDEDVQNLLNIIDETTSRHNEIALLRNERKKQIAQDLAEAKISQEQALQEAMDMPSILNTITTETSKKPAKQISLMNARRRPAGHIESKDGNTSESRPNSSESKHHHVNHHTDHKQPRGEDDISRPSSVDNNNHDDESSELGKELVEHRLTVGEGLRIVSVKNRFKHSCFNGYRDVLVYFVVEITEEHAKEGPVSSLKLHENEADTLHTIQVICELQIHHSTLYRYGFRLNSYHFYTYFRDFFGSSSTGPESSEEGRLEYTNKLKALKTMDQVGEFIEELEGAMQVYLGGIGRVGRDLPRIRAYFLLFARVGEVALAEAMQTSIITQLRNGGDSQKHALFRALSELAGYFMKLRRYNHALPLSEEALTICQELYGKVNANTAEQLTNHSDLMYCCNNMTDALSLYEEALEIKREVFGDLHPLTYTALTRMAELYDDADNFDKAEKTYLKVLDIHQRIAMKSRTGQAGPGVADTMIELAHLHEYKNNFQECLRYYNKAQQVYEDFYGPSHESRAKCLTDKAFLSEQQNNMEDALHLHLQALQLRITLFEESSKYMGYSTNDVHNNPPWPTLADSHNYVGQVLIDLGDNSNAVHYLEVAVSMQQTLAKHHENHVATNGKENAEMSLASSLTFLSWGLMQLGAQHYQRCAELLNEAYSIRMRYVGVRSQLTEHTMNIQGILVELIEEYKTQVAELQHEADERVKSATRAQVRRSADYNLDLEIDHLQDKSSSRNSNINDTSKPGSANLGASPRSGHNSARGTPKGTASRSRSGTGPSSPTRKGDISENGLEEPSITSNTSSLSPLLKSASRPDAAFNSNITTATTATTTAIENHNNNGNGNSNEDGIDDEDMFDGKIEFAMEGKNRITILKSAAADDDHVEGDHTTGSNYASDLKQSVYSGTHQGDANYIQTTVEGKYIPPRKSVYDTMSIQQLDPVVKAAQDVMETVEHLHAVGGYPQALKLIGEVAAKLVPEHKMGLERKTALAIILSDQGAIYHDCGYNLFAIDSFRQAMDLLLEVYGQERQHEDLALVYLNLGLALNSAREYRLATVYLLMAREVFVSLLSPDCNHHQKLVIKGELPDTSRVGTPAQNQSPQHQYQQPSSANGSPASESSTLVKSFPFAENSEMVDDTNQLDMQSPLMRSPTAFKLDESDDHLTLIEHALGIAYAGLNELDTALIHIDKALKGRKAQHKTEYHPDYSASLNMKGYIYSLMGRYEEALDSMENSGRLRLRLFGTSDPQYVLGTMNQGSILFMLEDLAHAGRIFTETVESRERQLGNGSRQVLHGLHNLRSLFIRQEDRPNEEPFEKGIEQVSKVINTALDPDYTDINLLTSTRPTTRQTAGSADSEVLDADFDTFFADDLEVDASKVADKSEDGTLNLAALYAAQNARQDQSPEMVAYDKLMKEHRFYMVVMRHFEGGGARTEPRKPGEEHEEDFTNTDVMEEEEAFFDN